MQRRTPKVYTKYDYVKLIVLCIGMYTLTAYVTHELFGWGKEESIQQMAVDGIFVALIIGAVVFMQSRHHKQ